MGTLSWIFTNMFSTPRKTNKHVCVVCGCMIKPALVVEVNSTIGRQHHYPELLLKYGEINISDGTMCKLCMRRLMTLDKHTNTFREQCQATLRSLPTKRERSQNPLTSPQVMRKRHIMSHSPSISQENKENHPVCNQNQNQLLRNAVPARTRLLFNDNETRYFILKWWYNWIDNTDSDTCTLINKFNNPIKLYIYHVQPGSSAYEIEKHINIII